MIQLRLFILFLMTCFASQGQLPQKVILKNESEIKGKIISEDSVKIKIKTSDGNVWVFNSEDVDEIQPLARNSKGLFIHVEPVILAGENTNASIHLKAGYNFNRRWSGALGFSLERYDYNFISFWPSHNNDTYVPLFFEAKYHIFDHYLTPYLNVQGGYLFPTEGFEQQKGGMMASASLNMVCYTGEHFGITIGGGYRFNRLVRPVSIWLPDELQIDHINRIEIKMGMIFK